MDESLERAWVEIRWLKSLIKAQETLLRELADAINEKPPKPPKEAVRVTVENHDDIRRATIRTDGKTFQDLASADELVLVTRTGIGRVWSLSGENVDLDA